jgi:TonB family protein
MVDALQKRCFMGAIGLHGVLFLALVFGSALFVAQQKPDYSATIKVIPSRFVEGLSGGGGNPDIPITNEQKKGDPNAEAEVKPKPTPPPVKPPEVKKVETPKPVEAKPPEVVKTVPKIKDDILLKPTVRKTDKVKIEETKATKAAKVEAAAKAKADAKAEAEAKATRDAVGKLASRLDKSVAGLSRGFAQGTAVDVGGPGGEAYADYAQYVKQMYDDAWVVMSDLTADEGIAVVKVTISRDGQVMRAVIIERSGQRQLDLSVQNALDKVKKLPPFPAEVKDAQRSFTIEFNMKAKRSAA